MGCIAAGACHAPASDGARGAGSKVTTNAFDKNDVLDDASLRDTEAMSADDVQSFLDATPWGTKSALASYEEDGRTAAQIIYETSVAHGINPLELLVRAQMEQGLISKKTASTSTIALAFGCGCPDSPACSDKYKGLANQAECAAGTLARSMERAVTSSGTVSGWARDRAKQTEDGITVTPKNAATAALYTYTPWVGEAGGGRKGVGGVSLHHAVWDRFATAVGYGAAATNQDDTVRGDDAGGGAAADDDDAAMSPPDPSTPNDDDAGALADDDGGMPAYDDAGSSGTHAPGGSSSSADGGRVKSDGGTPPSDGSEDDSILGQGNAPPSSNAPPPEPDSAGRHSSSEGMPEATSEELAGKPKSSSGGCAVDATGASAGGGDAALLGLAVASVLVTRRRRRDERTARDAR